MRGGPKLSEKVDELTRDVTIERDSFQSGKRAITERQPTPRAEIMEG